LTLTTAIILQPLLSKLNSTPKQILQTRPTIQSSPRFLKSSPGILPVQVRRSPETPMPKTPLVRELETFDLS
ncbi:MAG: hypothetical protein ABI406_08380, partial [Ktedonobacteraceae bacterium]